MGTKGRCGHCRRPIGWKVYCPLRDTDTLTCVFGTDQSTNPRGEVNKPNVKGKPDLQGE